MLKAGVKIAVIIHLEDAEPLPFVDDKVSLEQAQAAERVRSSIKHQLAIHFTGSKTVQDKATAERLLEAINSTIQTMMTQLSVQAVTGGKDPDLAAAFGGEKYDEVKS